jgi:ABC-type phosphate transport system substrate-binding protein
VMQAIIDTRRRRVAALLCATTMALAVTAGATVGSASAQPVQQTGLVNLAVTDNTVQLPIAIAANVCGVSVNALAQQFSQTGTTTCRDGAVSLARNTGGGGGGGGAQQNGLINVDISNNTVQVPITVAANICGVSVNLLVQQFEQNGSTTCAARSRGSAQA